MEDQETTWSNIMMENTGKELQTKVMPHTGIILLMLNVLICSRFISQPRQMCV